MTASEDYYEALLATAPIDWESFTCVVVTSATREFVAQGLDVDPALPVDASNWDEDYSAYALAEVSEGVVAIENTGFADPSVESLRRLSEGGRRASVVRSNIQAHVRFGRARDGEIIFDDDEYTFIRDPERVPAELRGLFNQVWLDPSGEDFPEADSRAIALAMGEVMTGVEITADDLQRAWDSGFFKAPRFVYP